MSRLATTIALWAAGALLVAVALFEGGPRIWDSLFPGPAAPARSAEPRVELSEVQATEAVHRFLATWGQHAQPGATLELAEGRSPAELQRGLRGLSEFEGLEVYVTPRDDLYSTLRVLDGSRTVLQQVVRPWLPERPAVPPEAPALGFLVFVREADEEVVRRLGRWRSPLAIAVPPFAAHALRVARQATIDRQGVWVIADPAVPLAEQIEAVPGAAGVVVEAEAGAEPDKWLAGARATPVLDASSGGRWATAGASALILRRVGAVEEPGFGPTARALAIRRRGGLVTAEGNDAAIAELEGFVETTREDGYRLRLPSEVAQEAEARR